MMVKERDEDLALFLNLRISEQENESNGGHLIASSDEVDAPLGCNPLGSPISKAIAVPPTIKDEFLDSENDRTDFDWLLSPPRNTIFPPCKSEQNGIAMTNHDRPTALTSLDVENVNIEVVATKKTQVLSCGVAAAAVQKKKPSSSEPLTSTRRRASSTPRQPVLAAAPPNKQPSRISWPSTKPVGPTTRPTARSSTPTMRSTTPKVVSAPPVRSSSASRSRSTVSKTTTCDSTKNLNPKKEIRPVSASKARANYSQSLVAEASSRRRASSGGSSERCLSSGRSRRQSTNGSSNGSTGSSQDVNPVLMGTQMVERIVNMRKLARPDQGSYHQVTDVKFSSSIDKSLGFGRSLSKKSLDMAMRHMDISSSVNGNLGSLRFGSRKDHHYQKSDAESPLGTRSNASSSSEQTGSSSKSMGELVEDIGISLV